MTLDQFAPSARWRASLAARASVSPRVLIAEDNEESRDVLTEAFREDGSLEYVSPSVAKLTGIEASMCIEHPVLFFQLPF